MKRPMKYWMAALVAAAMLTGCRDEDSERMPSLRIPSDQAVVFGDYGESRAVDFNATDVKTVAVSELEGWQARAVFDQGKWRLELTSPASAGDGAEEGTLLLTGYTVDGIAVTATLDVKVDLTVPPEIALKEPGWRMFKPLEPEVERIELEGRYVTTLVWPDENAALFPGWRVTFPDAYSVRVTPPDSYAVRSGEASPGGLIVIEASRPTSTEKTVVRIPVRLTGGLFRADDALFDRSDVIDLTGDEQEAPYAGLVCHQWVASPDAPDGGFRSAVAYSSNEMSRQEQHTTGVVLLDGGEFASDATAYTPGALTEPVGLLYFMTAQNGSTMASYCIYRQTDALRELCLAADADSRSEEAELLREILLDAAARTASDAEGHPYGLVRIGSRYWLRTNLHAARLAGGAYIGLDKPGEVVEPRPDYTYCPYADDDENATRYGFLYDRAASLATGLCPQGYVLPDDEVLLQALLYAGDPMPAGAACSGTWTGVELPAPNLTGFAALPGGRREADAYTGLGEEVLLWTSDGLRSLRFDATEPVAYEPTRNPYAYVRCIKVQE